MELLYRFVEIGKPLAQGRAETLLLGIGDAMDEVVVLCDLGVGFPHLLDDDVDHLSEERFGSAQEPAVAHGPAQDSAKYVAPALVRGQDAVGDHERHRARMIGEDPQTRVLLLRGTVPHAGELLGLGHRRTQDVGLEVRAHALQDRCQSL